MARIREKTLKFPGLDNTYTFADEADLFDANVPCKAGEYRIYVGDLYRCNTDHTGAWDASHFNAVKMGNEVSGLKTALTASTEIAYGKNLFDKTTDNIFVGNINTTTNKLVSSDAARTFYMPCKPNTTYTVSKIKSNTSRFTVAFTDASTIAKNIDCTGVVYNNNATNLTSTSGAASKYILAFFYVTSDTTPMADVLASIQIEEGSEATAYQAYVPPHTIAKDEEARSEVGEVSDSVAEIRSEFVEEFVNFSDRFEKLADSYIDDFYERASFIDTNNPYSRYGANVSPTMVTGTGASIASSSSAVVYARDFIEFPVYFTIGNMKNAKKGIALYAREAPNLLCKYITIDTAGIVKYNNVSLGYLDELSDWFFVIVKENGVILYDDTGNRIDVALSYVDGLPKNYGLYFGSDNATYGFTSLIEWAYKPLDNFDVNRAIVMKNTTHSNHTMDTMRYSRSYIEDGERITVTDPGDDYIKVLDAEDTDDTVAFSYTNNPILRFNLDWSDNNTYRTEAGFNTGLVADGKLRRHKFQADFMIPESGNTENAVGSSYATNIIQVHDNNFSADGWSDPPPVVVYYENGKLYAGVRSLPSGEIPTSEAIITSNTYYLCDVPYDEWFTLSYETKDGFISGLAPYLVISVNGIEKLRVYTPIGYNIIQNGGFTRVVFGLYAPGLAYGTYVNTSRKIYATNVKYSY